MPWVRIWSSRNGHAGIRVFEAQTAIRYGMASISQSTIATKILNSGASTVRLRRWKRQFGVAHVCNGSPSTARTGPLGLLLCGYLKKKEKKHAL
jgi:hypothetical protein